MAASLDQTVKNPLGETNENKKVTIKENPNKKALLLGKTVDYYDLRRMPIVLRSKFSFYAGPSNQIAEAQSDTKKRIRELHQSQLLEHKKQLIRQMESSSSIYSTEPLTNLTKSKKVNVEETERLMKLEKERHDKLIGQLKAAEARNRNRILKLKYFNAKQDEIEHIIESQPTALKAVRLEAFLPPVRSKKVNVPDSLNPIERRKLEAIIDDDTNEVINRRL
ncbi:LKAAEAR1 isoform X2 [Brachionus plicatilis]|uniref:LKAAEAR1 isoform X2 n=1 Tax=Brachionus plicatilis TaxID=10195 RepID=A0A3M7PDJ5_BRAPC|nr:LKAAEAR1 isoform X2 [Brachionus plicatilis]